MLSDLRFALRQLAKSPGFTAVAVLTLALGIGANAAIFSVVNSALLRPLPYPDSGRLVQIWLQNGSGGRFPWVTGPQVKQWREHATSFDGIAAIHDRFALNLISGGRAERIAGAEVSANYLDVLRLRPALGRSFHPGEDQVGFENHVVILSHEWWQGRFGGDPAVIGRTLNFNRLSYTVVGVLPPHALPSDQLAFLVPLCLEDSPWRLEPANPWVRVTARLKPGVTLAQAGAEVTELARGLYARLLPTFRFLGAEALPLQTVLVENSRSTFLLLQGAVVLVLLIVCANVGNLLLARAAGRRKEMAVRLALGAGAGRVVRQVLTESVLLSLLGGAAGTFLAWGGVNLLDRMTARVLPGLLQPSLDPAVLLFSLVLAGGTSVLFGLVPALQACRTDVNGHLKEAGRGSNSGSRPRAQSCLVIAEVALTVMLLIGAGLLLRSFSRVLGADTGFDAPWTLVCDLSLAQEKFTTDEPLRQFERELVRRIQALPGVVAVGTTTTLPLSNDIWGGLVGLSEQPVAEHTRSALIDFVGADYFRAMGIRLRRGRLFTETDDALAAPPVTVINEELAAALLPGVNPLGRRIHFKDTDWEVIGVVGSVRQTQVDARAAPHAYAVHAYHPRNICLVVRAQVPPLRLAEEIRRAAAGLDPDESVANFRTLEQAVDRSLEERRTTLGVVAAFAGVALALASFGIYGVMTYTTRLRDRELCIRLALGAQRRDVIRLVLRDGLGLGLAGIVIGLLGGAAGARLLASRLYEVSAYDPLVFGAVAVAVTLAATAAICLPALRAARTDPALALRAE